MKGLAGFTQPGAKTSSDSSYTGTDSKRLLRLNKYTSTRRKPKSFEECVSASMGLACRLLEKGSDIKGFLAHVWFVAEQASLNRFRPDAILAYDQGVRDKAAKYGLDIFG